MTERLLQDVRYAWRHIVSAFEPNLLIDTTNPATVAAGIREILREGGRDYAQEIIGLGALLTRAPASERMSGTVAAR